ncbi:tyrosine-type recombinase/integrase [Paenibacillus sp. LHD-117]|uniref:site-specific tyrosine recombinase/integron integrase n=1 Tax=Paenibacillus sp. LHD-117 TaxID=3071412 RepID=UPI0027E1E2C3|nr:site-specific tyrosine recombinase/integron integrase [Paenibacillus sp. LHD-117]MDQ6418671.1 tyrosine-type recombinase/integrase [Paenibacillus sp. LHD-117]
MSNAGEQLLSEMVAMLAEQGGGINVNDLKSKLSASMSKYHVTRIDDKAVHPDVTEKIKLYLASKKLEGLSPLTLKGYMLDLNIFSNRVRKKVADVSSADIRTYLAQCDGNKMSTIGKKLSVLKSFFGWLASEEYIPRDPTTKLKTPKLEKRAPKALTIEELEMIREACQTRRQRAFIEAMYATGCRLSEVQALNRDDINLQTMSTRVIGKGNKEREVYFSFKAMFHIRKYLSDRKDNDPALFVSERLPHGRLSRRGIQREIGVIAALAGLQKRVSPHTLRHTFATLTLNNGAELAAVQQLLGHESPATTQIYAQYTEERKREQHKKFLVQ